MNQTASEAAYQSASAGIQPAEVDFVWNTAGTILTISPKSNLTYATGTDPDTTEALSYTFGFGSAATDLAGNSLAAVSSSFSTLRQLSARVAGDPLQDGSVDGEEVSNDQIDFQVSATSRGFLGFSISSLPADLSDAGVIAASLQVNSEFPVVFSGEIIELEHLLYGANLSASAYSMVALRSLPNLSEQTPKEEGWKVADVLLAVKDDLKNRLSRGNRSQYRLRCLNCLGSQTITFIAAEASDTAGDFRFKVPELVVEYLLP
jgi:hypothetical protein